jgi:hypothetical protein
LTRETEKSEKKHQLQIGFSRRFFSFLSFSENKKGRDDITLQLCKSFRHAMLFDSSSGRRGAINAPQTGRESKAIRFWRLFFCVYYVKLDGIGYFCFFV